jgi:hypothetical protein
MNKRAVRFASLLAIGILFALRCGTPDTAGRDRAIERSLNGALGVLAIPCCGQFNLAGDSLSILKAAERAGLVTLRELPQAYWDSFLSRTQGTGQPFVVKATDKLTNITGISSDSLPENFSPSRGGLVVAVSTAKVEKVVTDEEYKGPLASPGEKHRLLLGLYKAIPTPAAAAVGPALANQEEKTFQFRCIARYSDLKKAWSVVAIDAGSVEPERWFTNNVK